MKRREFIKNVSVLATGSVLLCGCSKQGSLSNLLYKQDDLYLYKKNVPSLIMTDELRKLEYKSVSELPTSVRLEACTLCQLRCPDCYMVKDRKLVDTIGPKFGYLKFENFKKFVDRNNFIKKIELSNSGEIFLNPDLIKIMEYAHEKGIKLTAINGVNLNTLSEEQAEALVKYEFGDMVLSIDGASQETYVKYRVNGNFDNVINNIKKIQKYQKKYNSEYPKMKWKFIIFGHNENDTEKAKAKAKELNIPIVFVRQYDPDFSPVKDIKRANMEIGKNHYNYDDDVVSMVEKFEKGQIKYIPCVDLFASPQINWDGRLLGCCVIFLGDFGKEYNAFEQDLIKVLNSPKFVYAKNMLLNKAPATKSVPCATCGIYADIRSMNKWIFTPDKSDPDYNEKF